MLSLYKNIEIFENCEIIRSTFHKIYPSETSKIINERDIISRTSFGGYRRRSPHISMHKIKRSKEEEILVLKGKAENLLVYNDYNQKNDDCPMYPRLP